MLLIPTINVIIRFLFCSIKTKVTYLVMFMLNVGVIFSDFKFLFHEKRGSFLAYEDFVT